MQPELTKWIKDKCKIRVPEWTESKYIYFNGFRMLENSGQDCSGYFIENIDRPDWELYEEPIEYMMLAEAVKKADGRFIQHCRANTLIKIEDDTLRFYNYSKERIHNKVFTVSSITEPVWRIVEGE